MRAPTWILLGSLGPLLAACGGSDGGVNSVASTPPPPIPGTMPTSTSTVPQLTSVSIEKVAPLSERAGLTAGTFDTKAITTSVSGNGQILPAGAVTLGIDPDKPAYTLTIAAPGFPVSQSFDFSTAGADAGFGYHIIRTEHYSDGSTHVSEEDKTSGLCCSPYQVQLSGGQFEGKSFSLNITPRYVSFGQWDEYVGVPVSGTGGGYNIASSKRIIFVQGIRTEPADIPVSGTASYHTEGSDYSLPFNFVADFGARTMAATIDVQGGFGEDTSGNDGFFPGYSAKGVAPITSAGDFLIALNGNHTDAEGHPTDPVSGQLDGALFGPQGAQVAGVYQFMGQSGTFVATKGP